MSENEYIADEYDSPWKSILEAYFQEFMKFFFPAIAEEIDWERGHTFLDKELQQVVRDAELGRRYADKLVQVYRRDGEETWVLVHVEVQGWRDSGFEQRMFVYNYRIFDRYERPVVSLAVLADEHAAWRPTSYGWDLWGCRMGIRFPVVKLLDYQDRWSELEESGNPFAVCTMAHLKTMETRVDPRLRFSWKLNLVRRLYDQGRDQQYVLDLFRFIDWMMHLPEDLAEGFINALTKIEGNWSRGGSAEAESRTA